MAALQRSDFVPAVFRWLDQAFSHRRRQDWSGAETGKPAEGYDGHFYLHHRLL